MSESALIHIEKIKSKEILRDALKHNLRQIARETSIPSHIDPTRSHLNVRLVGGADPVDITQRVVRTIKESTGKKLRANGVVAVEVMVSLPVNTAVDTSAFFGETLDWLHRYWDVPVISAVVHYDEASPHMHVLLLPLNQGRMFGAALVGYRIQLAAFKRSHHTEVGSRFGLALVESVPRFKRLAAARKIIDCLQERPDWIRHPSIVAALQGAIATRPAELMSLLGIKPDFG